MEKEGVVHIQWNTAAAAAKSLQSCPTLCDPTDGSPPGSPIPGILQARILEWVAISFSNAWKWKVNGILLSHKEEQNAICSNMDGSKDYHTKWSKPKTNICANKKKNANLFTKQKQTHRHRRQTYGYQSGKGESESCSVTSYSLWPHGLYSPWNSPGQNTWVGSLSLLQGIFPTQVLNPGLPHYRQILYQLSHKGSLRILEWVAYPFSRGSSWPRNRTGISCIAGRFFTNWAFSEALTDINYYT